MTKNDRALLRALFVKEYKMKSGCNLICVEECGESDKQDTVIDAATRFFSISTDLITSRIRTKEVVECKQMIIKMMSSQGYTQRIIATKLGNIERSGIVYSLGKFEKLYEEDAPYKEKWDKFQQYCKEIL